MARPRPEQLLEQAEGYLLLEMPRPALDRLAAIDDPEFKPFDVHKLRGEAHRVAGDFEDSLNAFHAALGHLPESTDTREERVGILLGMAWAYKRIDQLQRAIAVTTQAHRLVPDDPIVMYNLACYHSLDRNKDQALSWLGRAIRTQASIRKLITDETDFDPLRDDPDFQFVAGLRDAADSR